LEHCIDLLKRSVLEDDGFQAAKGRQLGKKKPDIDLLGPEIRYPIDTQSGICDIPGSQLKEIDVTIRFDLDVSPAARNYVQ
jgi:hypothetical protein